MLLLRHTSPTQKERHYDSFLAGLLGGYAVFGRTIHNSVSQQIVIYVAARVCLALAKLAVQPRYAGGVRVEGAGIQGGGGWDLIKNEELRRAMMRNGWPVFASLSWAMVMYIFRWHPESVQSSLRSSMSYMWVVPVILAFECWLMRRQICTERSVGFDTDVALAQQLRKRESSICILYRETSGQGSYACMGMKISLWRTGFACIEDMQVPLRHGATESML
jgi:hypothetical protein